MLSIGKTRMNRWYIAPRIAIFSAIAVFLLGLLNGCVDPYNPDVISNPPSYLVVDGFINLSGVTTIRLSRTRSLSSGETSPAETQAAVAIQDEAGTRYALTEQAAGTYTSPALILSPAHQYQLRLRTVDGREYASDLVAGKLTPAIDSVSWEAEADGVQLYLDTHDATNTSRYYRWLYQETWEFRSAYKSEIEFVNRQFQPREEDIYTCWRTNTASPILLGTTDKLGQDVVARFPLTRLSSDSEKLHFIYSILVQQIAVTQPEFAYWDKLRKNTESLGTLFDPLPSQVSGNVQNLADATEKVLGYVGAGSVTEKRIFIQITQLPPGFRPRTGYESCVSNVPSTIPIANAATAFSALYLPLEAIYESPTSSVVVAYLGASASCVDCRLQGTNVKPDFWPY